MRSGFGDSENWSDEQILEWLNSQPEEKLEEVDRILFGGVAALDTETPPDWFHEGQLEGWDQDADEVLLLCGTQSGKTVFGPWWMLREMQRCGPGEYGAASPTYPIMFRKLLPEYKKVFLGYGLGRFIGSPVPQFEFSREGLMKVFGRDDEPCTLYFCYGSNSDTLESMTLKAFHSDECGQKAFMDQSFEAIDRRLAIHGGRHLMTSTPYEWNYLKTNKYDRWMGGDTTIAVVSFESIMNPTFPRSRWERAMAKLPSWKFDMMYRGKFTKPAGMIYDCFDRAVHCIPRFPIPRKWRRILGVDFGDVNLAGIFIAYDPDWRERLGRYIVYRGYLKGRIPIKCDESDPEGIPGHIDNFRLGEERDPEAWGGANSEDVWREDFANEGFPILKPENHKVEFRIQTVYGLLVTRRLFIFDDVLKLINELETYSREITPGGEILLKVDNKARFHRADALGYGLVGAESGADPEPETVSRGGRHVAIQEKKDNEDRRRSSSSRDDDGEQILYRERGTIEREPTGTGRRTGRSGRAFRGGAG